MRLLAQFVGVLLSLAMQGCRVSNELATARAFDLGEWFSANESLHRFPLPSEPADPLVRGEAVLLRSAFRLPRCGSSPMPDRSFLVG